MESECIKISSGEYRIQKIHLFVGRKKICKNQARINLLKLAKILDQQKIRYGLIFGTLLGAVRENDFIDWDEDVDIFVLEEDRKKFLDLLPVFEASDLRACRYQDDLLSLMGGNDYIDVYFFRKSFYRRLCNQFSYPSRFFGTRSMINFMDHDLPTVSNPKKFLRYVYGSKWRTPKKNAHAKPNDYKRAVRYLLNKYFPAALEILRTLKKALSKKH